MSIFGNLSALLGGGAIPDEAKGNFGDALGGILKNQGIDGIPGLLQKFQQSGMGAQAASWVSNNVNLPVSATHVAQALGPEVLTAIAGRFGIPPDQASQMLSKHLPGVVDHMTPDGTLPDGDTDDTENDDDGATGDARKA